MNNKVNDVVLVMSDFVSRELDTMAQIELKNYVDLRAYQPFGKDHDYSKEEPIKVENIFATRRFFADVMDAGFCSDMGPECARYNNWLAILDHYGFDAPYSSDFLDMFVPFIHVAVLQIYRDENAPIDERVSSALPRLFHGKQYKRAEFIDAFCCFFEQRGFEL